MNKEKTSKDIKKEENQKHLPKWIFVIAILVVAGLFIGFITSSLTHNYEDLKQTIQQMNSVEGHIHD